MYNRPLIPGPTAFVTPVLIKEGFVVAAQR
jgi:hypothetical protein